MNGWNTSIFFYECIYLQVSVMDELMNVFNIECECSKLIIYASNHGILDGNSGHVAHA